MKHPDSTTLHINQITRLAAKIALAILLGYWFIIGLTTKVIAVNEATPTPTESIGDKIKEKVQSLKPVLRPTAFVGEVTDKTGKTLTLNTKDGLRQVAINDSAKTFRQTGATRQTIKPEDIAIGDYVIAMGSLDATNKVLDGKRFIVTPKPTPSKVEIISGQITKIDSNTIILESNHRGEWKINIKTNKSIKLLNAKNTDLKLTDLEIQNRIIVVGKLTDNNSIDAKIILSFPGNTSAPTPSTTITTTPSPKPTKSPTPTKPS